VTIEPSEARAGAAQWRLTSGPDTGWKDSGVFINNLSAGSTYTITFRSVSSWTTPGNQSRTIVANATVTREGIYQPVQQHDSPISDEQYQELSNWLFGQTRTVTGRWRQESWPVTGQHTGVDYGAPVGTGILAATDGKVICVEYGSSCQELLCLSTLAIYHEATQTTFIYLHMETISVHNGTTVRAGDVLGTVR